MLKIKIRKAIEKDKKILFEWFNDKENFKYKLKLNPRLISKNIVCGFKNTLSDSNNFLSIIEVNNVLVGQIRLDYINIKKI